MADLAVYPVRALALIASAVAPAAAVVVGLLVGFGARALLRLLLFNRTQSWPVAIFRGLVALFYGALAAGFVSLAGAVLRWDRPQLFAGTAALLVLTVPTLWRRLRRKPPARPSLVGLLVSAVFFLVALLGATVVLVHAGFLELVSERPLLLVEVTGVTRPQTVRWAPPDQPLRSEALTSHQVILRTPSGEPVTEAWLYGDQVAIKGRVLRLSPYLLIAGLHNLFELSFAHNGYLTAERHATMPHQAVPLAMGGPLEVAPRWRPLRDRLLATWERKAAAPGREDLVIRAATIESTYFPLVDADGKPVRHTYQLVLTAGGLTGL